MMAQRTTIEWTDATGLRVACSGTTMSAPTDASSALRLLRGLEAGGLPPHEARSLAEALDPVLLYFVVRYLRAVYPASDRAASAVLERVVKLTKDYPGMVARVKQGEQDPVARWFAGAHSFTEFRARGASLIELIVDKLEA
jgi:hypothetical protein